MNRFLLQGLLLLSLPLAAQQIYRYVDEQGNVTFTSDPPPGVNAHPVSVSPVNAIGSDIIAPPPATSAKAEVGAEITEKPGPETGYQTFAITSPEEGSSVRSNDGDITISLTLDPALRESDTIYLYMDGAKIAEGDYVSFFLQNVNRGTHLVHAEVRDRSSGTTLKKTRPVTITVQRVHVGG
ncbi:MAG: DUF4124 domain-containing protein [Gammaproteobacteria bacterium]|jgi:hypothetical protein|nr:DUF4124 domain-containing protein [Gammaproteobacteria bacterium]